jgi:sortase A
MQPKRRANKHDRRSTILAVGFVAAAGAIAWFATTGQSAPHQALSEPAVMTAAPPAEAAALAPNVPGAGTLPTRIVAPKAGIDFAVQEVGIVKDQGKWVWQTAWQAAGHHMDSARPGQPGNMVLTGHVSVADSRNLPVFKALDRLASGDIVEVYSGDRVFRYEVDHVEVVAPSNLKILRTDHRSTVTMITCTRDLKNRLVVTGTLVGQV